MTELWTSYYQDGVKVIIRANDGITTIRRITKETTQTWEYNGELVAPEYAEGIIRFYIEHPDRVNPEGKTDYLKLEMKTGDLLDFFKDEHPIPEVEEND